MQQANRLTETQLMNHDVSTTNNNNVDASVASASTSASAAAAAAAAAAASAAASANQTVLHQTTKASMCDASKHMFPLTIIASDNSSVTVACVPQSLIEDSLWQALWRDISFGRWLLLAVTIVIFVIGLTGNTFVCLSVYRNINLRNVTNYFIVNLAVADCLVILVCLPPSVIWDLTLTWWFGGASCKLVTYLQNVSVSVSVLTLTCIAVDRYYAICHPLARFKSTTRRVGKTIACLWLIACLVNAPDLVYLEASANSELATMLGFTTTLYTDCRPAAQLHWPAYYVLVAHFLCLYCVPLLFMLVAYYHIKKVLSNPTTSLKVTNQKYWRYAAANNQQQHHHRAPSTTAITATATTNVFGACAAKRSTATSRVVSSSKNNKIKIRAKPQSSYTTTTKTKTKQSMRDIELTTTMVVMDLANDGGQQHNLPDITTTTTMIAATATIRPPTTQHAHNELPFASSNRTNSTQCLHNNNATATDQYNSNTNTDSNSNMYNVLLNNNNNNEHVASARLSNEQSCATTYTNNNSNNDVTTSGPSLDSQVQTESKNCATLSEADNDVKVNYDRQACSAPINQTLERELVKPSVSISSSLVCKEPSEEEERQQHRQASSVKCDNFTSNNNAVAVCSAVVVPAIAIANGSHVSGAPDSHNSANYSNSLTTISQHLMVNDKNDININSINIDNNLRHTNSGNIHSNSHRNGSNNNGDHHDASQKHNENVDEEVEEEEEPDDDDSAATTNGHISNEAEHRRRRKKAANMLMAIVCMFAVCFLPVHMNNILRDHFEIPQNEITNSLALVSHLFCYVNSAINPIIYNCMNREFRREFRKVFISCFEAAHFGSMATYHRRPVSHLNSHINGNNRVAT